MRTILGPGAKTRHGYGPLALGLVAATAVLIYEFLFSSTPFVYVGVALLVGASVWNAWPRKAARSTSCPKCAGQALEFKESSAQE